VAVTGLAIEKLGFIRGVIPRIAQSNQENRDEA